VPYATEVFSRLHSEGIRNFRPFDDIPAKDGRRMLAGYALGLQGRPVFLKSKNDSTSEFAFFILAAKWSCATLKSFDGSGRK
jgi:hypothetical protein